MFLELLKPELVDVSRLGMPEPRVKIRLREKSAPGRLWLNLSFETNEQAEAFAQNILTAIRKPVESVQT